uniref:Uncharacterized protein n=1 Tax=Meloidogyne enterolobii TaxID=390850 RepID=A0A6V7X2V5_MELEN|nr:unnamed protein product [Meloidogyne enterolobii]
MVYEIFVKGNKWTEEDYIKEIENLFVNQNEVYHLNMSKFLFLQTAKESTEEILLKIKNILKNCKKIKDSQKRKKFIEKKINPEIAIEDWKEYMERELLYNDKNDEFKQFLQCEADAIVVKEFCDSNISKLIKTAEEKSIENSKKQSEEAKNNFKEIENNGEIKELVNINSSIETQHFLEQNSNKGKDKLFQINENSQDVVEFIKEKSNRKIPSVRHAAKRKEYLDSVIRKKENKKEKKKPNKNSKFVETVNEEIIPLINDKNEEEFENEIEKNLIKNKDENIKNDDILIENILIYLNKEGIKFLKIFLGIFYKIFLLTNHILIIFIHLNILEPTYVLCCNNGGN